MKTMFVVALVIISPWTLFGETTLSGAVSTRAGSPINNAIVFLTHIDNTELHIGRRSQYILTQRGMQFIPHVLPVPATATVLFGNDDPFPHNIFSADGEIFLGTYGPSVVRSKKLQKPGVHVLLCNIHAEMSAFLVVLPTTHFATSDTSGNYLIDNLPDGTYKLSIWTEHSKPEYLKNITIADAVPTTQHIVINK